MSIKFPADASELRAAGYEYDGDGRCRACGEALEWWITPKGKKMPLSRVKVGDQLKQNVEKLQPHFADCPEADAFRRAK
jgi:hypothetical protein